MPKSKANDKVAAFVGISAPETPKYLLANNFLLEYFEQTGGQVERYSYAWFEQKGSLTTQDMENQKELERSFNRFLKRYLGDETIHQENNRLKEDRHFYFPLTQEMLMERSPTLRHMLFHLQALDDGFCYEDMQQKLENYIFHGHSGANNIWRVLFQEKEEIHLRKRDVRGEEDDFWDMLKPAEKKRMRALGESLNQDLNALLTYRFFTELDFYRKYQYLSVLLTSYVLQYILVRKGPGASMLCKGKPLDDRLNGDIHRACSYNYARLREVFPEMMKVSYGEALETYVGKKESFRLSAHDKDLWLEEKPFEGFMVDLSGREKNRKKIAYEVLLKGFGIGDGEEKKMTKKEFVMRYLDLIGRRQGSNLQKMSFILSSSGKQIDMVYPKTNVNAKYFAMSEGLAEFYVRLYLARKKIRYDYLDNFMEDLVDRYHIVISKTSRNEKYLKTYKPLLSAQELWKNKQAFLDTLNGANCLIKLSDSGFIVTLPEEKGGFKLI